MRRTIILAAIGVGLLMTIGAPNDAMGSEVRARFAASAPETEETESPEVEPKEKQKKSGFFAQLKQFGKEALKAGKKKTEEEARRRAAQAIDPKRKAENEPDPTEPPDDSGNAGGGDDPGGGEKNSHDDDNSSHDSETDSVILHCDEPFESEVSSEDAPSHEFQIEPGVSGPVSIEIRLASNKTAPKPSLGVISVVNAKFEKVDHCGFADARNPCVLDFSARPNSEYLLRIDASKQPGRDGRYIATMHCES